MYSKGMTAEEEQWQKEKNEELAFLKNQVQERDERIAQLEHVVTQLSEQVKALQGVWQGKLPETAISARITQRTLFLTQHRDTCKTRSATRGRESSCEAERTSPGVLPPVPYQDMRLE